MTALLSLAPTQQADAPSDEQLVDLVRNGTSGAFALLVERHQPKARHLAHLLVHDENDASDIVQEAFLRVFRKLGDFSGDAAFYTWFYRIVYNLSVDFLRRPYRRRVRLEHLETLLGAFAPLALPRDRSQRPDDAVRGLELSEHILAALTQLSVHHRDVVILREVWGMSYFEMAHHLGCAKGTVMSRLFHARQRLQVLLHDVHHDEFADEGGASGSQRLNEVPTFGSLST